MVQVGVSSSLIIHPKKIKYGRVNRKKSIGLVLKTRCHRVKLMCRFESCFFRSNIWKVILNGDRVRLLSVTIGQLIEVRLLFFPPNLVPSFKWKDLTLLK